MGLETGVTKIDDLNALWPLATDERSEGDNHLRAIKVALRSLLTNLNQIGIGPASLVGQAGKALKVNAGETAYDLVTLLTTAAVEALIAEHAALPIFVDRGDPEAADLVKAGMTLDSGWHDWDLSSIVPAGATAVLIRISAVAHASLYFTMFFRKNGNSNIINVPTYTCWPGTPLVTGADVIVPLDTGRVIEYMAFNDNISSIGLTVGGWWK